MKLVIESDGLEPGTFIYFVPSRLQEAVGVQPMVVLLKTDFDKYMKIIKLYNPASGVAQ